MYITTDFGQTKISVILEDAFDAIGVPIVRKWSILGYNRFHPNGIDIQNGSTKRVIFPADFSNYYIR